ncbi:MAG: PCRF domain-containing protein, partial [Actinobacteria bacterium]|nr:PCRF domain-containing protein [Actinomycetota bacterium]
MQDSLSGLRAEHASLQKQLSDSAVHTNPALAKKVNRRYAELSAILLADDDVKKLEQDLVATRELASEDSAFSEELPNLEERLAAAKEKLRRLLIPRDPDDGRDVIMEIKAGEGGAESALFA